MQMEKLTISSLALAAIFAADISEAAETIHWGYIGDIGPEYWGELDESFAACAEGKNQSPIDLNDMLQAHLPRLKINYTEGGNRVVNNGHSIQIDYEPGSTMTIDEHTFELKQLHFHAPSENTIDGESFPMEAHFVHADENGNLAVIAQMYKAGEENEELQRAWAYMPQEANQSYALENWMDATSLLPHKRAYYRYNGSLTTPPCTEGVTWVVMKKHEELSQEQIDKFAHVMHHDNNRPIQPVNARLIAK